ncbi:hypothetical protein OFR22_02990 [Brachyspira hyodysenteriae]|uniref:Transmembrane protein n=1 Tax=Brachyspira hyodysenteriae ATCC 27164 TaxID=1266923 RepID=A0A3B6VY37_BRAHO|nr:hypothetical protein [Brachyspira hyodysenteriae]ANN63627.1 hypothetical protein BHYOB78_07020 [Brachyspira hyodysenteriae ATCC 27164]KLI13252.1 membrane protein [Brachyspira hyodysenteriae]KLI20195.1 membrane protein [Brachyspira hyodysenteriae]KLI28179.1 membrane protein [Brachyspira hyodysenteriae]KLI30900.1 membrane protein [Brachyspira hyodysenteriae]
MKNNIMSVVKSKKFIIISASIAAAALFISAVRFLGLQYYMFYLMHDFDEFLEALLKIAVFAVMVMFAIVLFKKIDSKDNKQSKESESNNEKKDLIVVKDKNNKSKSLIIIFAVIGILALISLFVFYSRFFGMHYMLYNLDDIVEGIFQLAVVIAVIGFGAVFAKKLLEKL